MRDEGREITSKSLGYSLVRDLWGGKADIAAFNKLPSHREDYGVVMGWNFDQPAIESNTITISRHGRVGQSTLLPPY